MITFLDAATGASLTGEGPTIRAAYPGGLTTAAHRLWRPDGSELVPEATPEKAGPVVIVARVGWRWGKDGERSCPTPEDLAGLVGVAAKSRKRGAK